MASLSTLIPVHLEMNLSDNWIEWVAAIIQGVMARPGKKKRMNKAG